ncbi:hypothetical protein MRX96_058637 [Rhipicephalus microplus]
MACSVYRSAPFDNKTRSTAISTCVGGSATVDTRPGAPSGHGHLRRTRDVYTIRGERTHGGIFGRPRS